jgi:hypothetical protein
MLWVIKLHSRCFVDIMHIFIINIKKYELWMQNLGYRFVLDQHAEVGFYSAISLKQQSADRHVAPLGHIILIPIQPVFVLTPCCFVRIEEAKHSYIIHVLVFLKCIATCFLAFL